MHLKFQVLQALNSTAVTEHVLQSYKLNGSVFISHLIYIVHHKQMVYFL